MVSKVMNEANLLPIMRQADKSLSVNDEKVKVVKDIFGSLNSFVSEKMKMLVLKIADGTVSPSFVRKNMDAVRSLNKDRNAVKAELKKEILAMKDEEDVLLSLSNEEVLSSLVRFPVRSDYMKKGYDDDYDDEDDEFDDDDDYDDFDDDDDFEDDDYDDDDDDDGDDVNYRYYEKIRETSKLIYKKSGYRALLERLEKEEYVAISFDDYGVMVADILCKEGAVGVGAFGASWCTCVAGANCDNMYDKYADDDLKIVFIEGKDEPDHIWQVSSDEFSACMDKDDNQDCDRMCFAIVDACGKDSEKVSDVIELLPEWAVEWFETNFPDGNCEYEKSFRYEVIPQIDSDLVVVERCMTINKRKKIGKTQCNVCRKTENYEDADYIFDRWFETVVVYDKVGLICVSEDDKYDFFDIESGKFILPEPVDFYTFLTDSIIRINTNDRYRLFDARTKKFLNDELYTYAEVISFYDDVKTIYVKGEDGKTRNFIIPETGEEIVPGGFTSSHPFDFLPFIRIVKTESGKSLSNIFSTADRKLLLPEWVGNMVQNEYPWVFLFKNGKQNVYHLMKQKMMLPEYVEHVSQSESPFKILVMKEKGRYNVFDLKTEKYLFDPDFEEMRPLPMEKISAKIGGEWKTIELDHPEKMESRICECCGRRF